jgi:hypothetical protein
MLTMAESSFFVGKTQSTLLPDRINDHLIHGA